jgi:lipoate-protein ligase A
MLADPAPTGGHGGFTPPGGSGPGLFRPAPKIGAYDADEPLLAAVLAGAPGGVRVYRPAGVAVVLGRGSRPERELHLERCLADGVPLLRRRGGGCAVVLDPGNVIVSLALPVAGIGDNLRHFARISEWLAAALARVGVAGVRREGSSDLALGERKVGGACIYRTRGLLFYGATLLVAPEVELHERYLRHPPREPPYRRGRTHAEFVGSLGAPATVATAARLERELGAELAHTLPA